MNKSRIKRYIRKGVIMPELPEVYNISKQMNNELAGKKIIQIEVLQEKCLNMTVDNFRALIADKPIEKVYSKGKWIFIKFADSAAYMLISLGMGGEIIYHSKEERYNSKYQFKFTFDDKSFMHILFYWFGYVHATDETHLKEHKMTAELGICPLSSEFTYEKFKSMLIGKKGRIKSYLMNQHNISGIGNVYIQDILFKAGIHPNRKIKDITETELAGLYKAITGHLQYAAELGGLVYEHDFYGQKGRYTYDLIGHRPGSPCPICGTIIKEIKCGSTRSFICEKCQQ